MAKVIAYEYEIKGARQVLTTQDQIKKAIKETNQELGKTDVGTDEYKRLNDQLAVLKNAQKDVRDEQKLAQLELVAAAEAGKKSYRGLNAELKLLESQFERLSVEARKTKEGIDLADNIKEIREEIKGINEERGKTGIRGALEDSLGDLAGFDVTKLASISGAITLGAQAAASAAQFVGDLVPKFNELRSNIELLTGATGDELDDFTARVASIATTFDKSQEEILQAANSVSNQLDISFNESLDRIQEGLVAGSDLNGEFISSLQEYPTFFKEAGLSADAFFKVANRQATEGIFSDKGLDAVKEATIRLRELPDATAVALEGIGLASTEIRQVIDEEGIGGAIALVSERLATLEADSPDVGRAIADIFGGAGEDAGLAFLTSLQDINDETQGLLDTTTEFQEQQLRTLEINEQNAAVQNEVARALAGTGATMANVSTQIQTGLLRVLLFIIDLFQKFWAAMQPVRDALLQIGESLGLVTAEGQATQRLFNIFESILSAQEFLWNLLGKAIGFVVEQVGNFVGKIVGALEFLGIIDENARAAAESTSDLAEAQTQSAEAADLQTDAFKRADVEIVKTGTSLNDYTKAAKAATEATEELAAGSIAKLRKNLQDLQTQLEGAAPDDIEGILTKVIGAEEALEKAENLVKFLRGEVDKIEPVELLPPIDQTKDFAEELGDAIKDAVTSKTEEIATISLEQIKTISGEIFGFISEANSLAADASEARIASELRQVEDRYERELAAVGTNIQEQRRLEGELAAERERLAAEEFEQQKKFRVAEVLTSLASGIVNTLAAPSTIPDPFGTIFKAGRIGFLTGTAIAQIATINAQTAERGTIIRGQVRGQTHQGPSKGVLLSANGRLVLVEHNENVQRDETGAVTVINKRSAAVFGKQLKASTGRTWKGKSSWLSSINNYKNWGVPYMAEGGRIQPSAAALSAAGSGGSAPIMVSTQINQDDMEVLAAMVATAVQSGAKDGVMAGAQDANRQAEREARLQERTGV